MKFLSCSLLGLLKVITTCLQSQMFWGLIFPVQDPQARELTPLGEPLQCNYSPVCGSPTLGYGTWLYCKSAPPTISLWFLLDVFSYRRPFLVGSYLFHQLLFSRWLWFWCAYEKKWVQSLCILASWPSSLPYTFSVSKEKSLPEHLAIRYTAVSHRDANLAKACCSVTWLGEAVVRPL